MNAARLLQLARHLERGKLGHDEFEFAVFHHVNCKTSGCALGECHVVFPDDWTAPTGDKDKDDMFFPSLKSIPSGESWKSAEEFFGIIQNEAFALFNPGETIPWQEADFVLRDNATRKEVAANIRAFVAWKAVQA